MKKALLILICAVLCCGIVAGCSCVHEWSEGDCENPKTCTLCGEQEGGPMGHTWQEAACTAPQTCSTCGAVQGEALGHDYESVTYEPTELDEGVTVHTCSICGDRYEDGRVEALGYPITEGTLVFRPDGVAYLYGANQEVVETFTGWMTEVYEIEDDYEINGGGVMTTTPWYFTWLYVTNVVIENGVTPASTAYWFTWLPVQSALIGDGITSLDEAMFMYCSDLSTVKFSRNSGLEKIGDYAFEDCRELSEITLPDGVTQIGDGAFFDANVKLEIPRSLMQIGAFAVNSCVVTVADDHPRFRMQDNCLIDTETKTLVAAFEGGIIPDDGSVTRIGDGALYGCRGVQSIVIPEGITHIGDGAFYFCTGLKYVTFPETLVSIGNNAFAFCGFESLTIPDSVTVIGEGAFWKCNDLRSITLPEGLTTLAASTFEKCSALQEVLLPQGLTEIGASAFAGCTQLRSIELPEGLTTLAASAFEKCSALQEVLLPQSLTEIGASAFLKSGLNSITLPQGVTVIGDYAFTGCTSLQQVLLPESLTTIGNLAFYGCTGLTTLTIPAGVTTIGENPFAYCVNLTDLTVSGDNTAFLMQNGMLIDINNRVLILFNGSFMYAGAFDIIGAYACAGHEGMTIVIPEGVTAIGDYAFADCSNLVSLHIPDSVCEIGADAFMHCTALSSVTIPDGVTTLDGWFKGCTGLRILELPASITSIGDCSFEGCELLRNIKFRGSKEQWKQIDKTWYWCGWEMSMEIVCTDGVVREAWYFPY